MKNIRFLIPSFLLIMHTTLAPAQNTVEQLKSYTSDRDQIKAMDLPAVQAIAADAKEKNSRRGLAEYYIFLKNPPNGNVAAGAKSANDLEKAGDKYMDPCTYIKLAAMFSQDFPAYGVKQDQTKMLRYLSIAWEIGDLSDKATGSNAVLTLIIDNTLGLGDDVLGGAGDRAALKKTLDAVRPDVLKARERFKKLYGLSVKDEDPASTNVERHYGFR